LIAEAEDALAGNSPYDAEAVLETIHYFLIHDDRIDDLLAPHDDARRLNEDSVRGPPRQPSVRSDSTPREEFETQVQVAKALRYIYSYANKTRYIPVRLEKLDIPGMSSPVEGDPKPIGRKRVGKDETFDEMEEEITINHEDCEHVLVVALPRKGKDSTITSLCGNLKDEHGYKWFSCLDDGRNETPMTAIPNDEKPIKDNLDDFGQEPKAYDAEVFVPATSGRSRHSTQQLHPFHHQHCRSHPNGRYSASRAQVRGLEHDAPDRAGTLKTRSRITTASRGSSNVSRTTPKSWRRRSRSPNYGTTSSTRMIKAIVN